MRQKKMFPGFNLFIRELTDTKNESYDNQKDCRNIRKMFQYVDDIENDINDNSNDKSMMIVMVRYLMPDIFMVMLQDLMMLMILMIMIMIATIKNLMQVSW